jgi:RNA polymerase sigma factor (TIGR02999 family)
MQDPEPPQNQTCPAELSASSVTFWLVQWRNGDPQALEEVMEHTYDELRRVASRYLQQERREHTLQPTALVHEVYLQLADAPMGTWETRAQFVAATTHIMRHLLIGHARRRLAAKRGGGQVVSLEQAAVDPAVREDREVLDVDEALERLKTKYPRAAQVVELRFFGGLSLEECAHVISANGTDMSLRTAERDWKFARAWLRNYIDQRDGA